ncbi:MAG: hypothetical protein JO023_16035 [Chloroflexi bacterium]|nr:hypothetical protein [Chloroflexota bacterium]
MRRLAAWLAVLCLLGCGRPDRPLRGAEPGSTETQPGLPPTLAVSDSRLQAAPLASPSPPATAKPASSPALAPTPAVAAPSPAATAAVVAAGSPSAAPTRAGASQPPIVRTIAPAQGGQVPAGGPVTVSAVLVGRGADLADASLTIDGAPAGNIDKTSSTQWSISASQALGPGAHTARVLVTDAQGGHGGFTWQFTVGGAPAPAPQKPTARPSPTG